MSAGFSASNGTWSRAASGQARIGDGPNHDPLILLDQSRQHLGDHGVGPGRVRTDDAGHEAHIDPRRIRFLQDAAPAQHLHGDGDRGRIRPPAVTVDPFEHVLARGKLGQPPSGGGGRRRQDENGENR
jgi:hypothetical protein